MARLLIFTLLFLLPASSLANEIGLVEQFFSPDGINNKQDAYTGEMLSFIDKPTLGETLPAKTKIKIRLLASSNKRKVYAVSLSVNGKSHDYYTFILKEENQWKISAIRKLALPGIFYITLEKLQNKTRQTDKEKQQYQNMLLTVKSDAELKTFLLERKHIFDKIVKLAKTNLRQANQLANSIYINSVKHDDKNGIVDMTIGGMLDNSVGYLYIPDDTAVPEISASDYIYVEHIIDNWYIYKTT